MITEKLMAATIPPGMTLVVLVERTAAGHRATARHVPNDVGLLHAAHFPQKDRPVYVAESVFGAMPALRDALLCMVDAK